MPLFIDSILSALNAGKTGTLATVLESRGSSPRGAGASMFVLPDGSFTGTIGGGSLEYAAIQRASSLAKSGSDAVESFNLSNEEAGGLGMVCGGEVMVLFTRILPGSEMAAAIRKISEHLSLGECVILRRAYENKVLKEISIERGRLKKPMFEGGSQTFVFKEPIGPQGRALIFGGGHVSKALAPVLSTVGFPVTVLDDRAEFVTKERFPTAEKLLSGGYAALVAGLEIAETDSVIIMTRGHESDYEILKATLQTGAAYIGCIGSRRKVSVTKDRLTGAGYTQQDLERIHAPIGLAIGAETPEEIAVSIAAELIAARAGVLH